MQLAAFPACLGACAAQLLHPEFSICICICICMAEGQPAGCLTVRVIVQPPSQVPEPADEAAQEVRLVELPARCLQHSGGDRSVRVL